MKFSIITINRNNKKGLEATIKSVIGQAYGGYQYIVIDGASTDGSTDIIKQYGDKIGYWVSEPDKGIYNAMNKGIRQATGEYLLFLNSGDVLYDPSILSDIDKANPSEDIIYGDILYEGSKTPFIMPDKITLSTFLGSSIGHGASFIKAELFKKYGLYNETNKMVSDWEFFLIAVVKSECSYRHINKTFTVYQQGGISIDPEYNRLQLEERNDALRRIFPPFYDIIADNVSLKERLAFYEHSRIIQLLKKWQQGSLNRFKNKLFPFKRS